MPIFCPCRQLNMSFAESTSHPTVFASSTVFIVCTRCDQATVDIAFAQCFAQICQDLAVPGVTTVAKNCHATSSQYLMIASDSTCTHITGKLAWSQPNSSMGMIGHCRSKRSICQLSRSFTLPPFWRILRTSGTGPLLACRLTPSLWRTESWSLAARAGPS